MRKINEVKGELAKMCCVECMSNMSIIEYSKHINKIQSMANKILAFVEFLPESFLCGGCHYINWNDCPVINVCLLEEENSDEQIVFSVEGDNVEISIVDATVIHYFRKASGDARSEVEKVLHFLTM